MNSHSMLIGCTMLLVVAAAGAQSVQDVAATIERDVIDLRTAAIPLSRDGAGRMARFRDALGLEHECTYDERGSLIRLRHDDLQGIQRQTIFGYDARGNLSFTEYPSGYRVFYSYDADVGTIARDANGNRVQLGRARQATSNVHVEKLARTAQSMLDLTAWLRAN